MSSPRRVLAIDPGRTGAAVLAIGDGSSIARAGGAWTWRPRKHGYTLQRGCGGKVGVADLHEVACELRAAAEGIEALVVEGLFAPRRETGEAQGKHLARMARQLTLAQSKGEVLGPLRSLTPTLYEPMAREWRAKVLRCGNKRRKVAEAYALKVVPAHIMSDLGPLAANVHVVEAAAMAYFGLVHLRLDAQRSP